MLKKIKNKKLFSTLQKKRRSRFKLKKINSSKPRLSVHVSNMHIYAQLIDDDKGITIASASTLDKAFKLENSCNIKAAEYVGTEVAKQAVEKGVKEVVFDRGAKVYHGRIKALAESAREQGLLF